MKTGCLYSLTALTLAILACPVPVSAEEACDVLSGTKIRIKVPDIASDKLVLSWEGNLDCELSGEEIKTATKDGFIQLNVPAAEVKSDGTSERIGITASDGAGRSREIDVELRSKELGFYPKAFFYFDEVADNEASIGLIERKLADGEIYKVFYMSRELLSETSNYNIKLVSTYFYYQSAIQIDTSPKFSKGRMWISTDARQKMTAMLKALDDPQNPEHDQYSRAYANKGRLLRSLAEIKTELGLGAQSLPVNSPSQ